MRRRTALATGLRRMAGWGIALSVLASAAAYAQSSLAARGFVALLAGKLGTVLHRAGAVDTGR